RALHDPAILHAGRACRLAGQTAEASVDVRDKRFRDGQAALIHLQDLVDASAGRIHLGAQYAIRRTMVQAESAMDTSGIEIPCRAVCAREIGWTGIHRYVGDLLLLDLYQVSHTTKP